MLVDLHLVRCGIVSFFLPSNVPLLVRMAHGLAWLHSWDSRTFPSRGSAISTALTEVLLKFCNVYLGFEYGTTRLYTLTTRDFSYQFTQILESVLQVHQTTTIGNASEDCLAPRTALCTVYHRVGRPVVTSGRVPSPPSFSNW